MMTPNAIRLIYLMALLALAAPAQALPFAVDLYAPGDGLLTRDPDGGLDWIDMTETRMLSYNQVVAELGPGGAFEGFRYATLAELQTLMLDSGIDIDPGADPMLNFAPIDALIALMGNSGNFLDGGFIGVTSELWAAGAHIQYLYGPNGYVNFDYFNGTLDETVGLDYEPNTMFGHFLVRPVPEPSTGLLLGLGLVGLGAARSRRDRREPARARPRSR